MNNVTFYFFKNNVYLDDYSAIEQLVCEFVAENWRKGECILIACEDEKQAIRIDEILWIKPSERFIPHNLVKERLNESIPVEISWSKKISDYRKNILINLRKKIPDFTTTFKQVIDFVPHKDSLKELARERYKMYRMAGFNLKMAYWNNEKNI